MILVFHVVFFPVPVMALLHCASVLRGEEFQIREVLRSPRKLSLPLQKQFTVSERHGLGKNAALVQALPF